MDLVTRADTTLPRSRITRRPISPSRRKAIYGLLFVSPWLIGFLVFTAYPMIASFILSFYRTNFMGVSEFVGLQWYRAAVSDALVLKAFTNTLYYVFVSVPLKTVMALVIALLLNQGIVAQGLWRTLYYLPSVVSGVAVSVLWQWLYEPTSGLFNTILRAVGLPAVGWIYVPEWAMPSLIIMALWGAGGAMLIYLAGLRGIPTSLYEAAEIDGAGPIRRFFAITIPMLTPTIFFNMVMNLIGAWQVFTQAFIMTEGGPQNATLTVVLQIYRTGFQNGYFGYASTQAWLLFLVILVFILLIIKSSSSWVQYERV